MSGTDRTKTGVERTGPTVILVEPQLGENIGMTARAMGNAAQAIKERHIANCSKADQAYGAGVAKALGLDLKAVAE